MHESELKQLPQTQPQELEADLGWGEGVTDTSESPAPVKPAMAWRGTMGLASPAGPALWQHPPCCPTRPCTWFRMSWLRLWHWSRGTPPASSMPSTRVVQRSSITAGTRKNGSSANSCLGQKVGGGGTWLQAPVAQLKDSSSSEKSSMNRLCLAFPPALLLPLCALRQYLAGLTFIQTFYPLIHSTNISVGPTLCLPLSWLLETQLPLPDQKYLSDIQLPHDEFNVLSSMNIIFFINLLIQPLKKQSLIYKPSSL